jgi:hypothetical protein
MKQILRPGRNAVRIVPRCVPAILALVGVLHSPVAAAQQDPVADSLIAAWIDVVGGMETYDRFQTAQFTVATVLYDTVSGRQKRSRPRYVWLKKGPYGEETRVERWETGGLIQQGFNGRDAAWAAEDGVLLPDSTKDSREALYVARDLFYWIGLPFKLRDPGVFLDYKGLEKRPGAEWPGRELTDSDPADGLYHAVSVSFGEGVGEHRDVFTYYFAPGNLLPTEVTYVEEGRTSVNRMLWGETRRSGSFSYPYVTVRTSITESGKRTKELIIYDVVINPDIEQTLFEEP